MTYSNTIIINAVSKQLLKFSFLLLLALFNSCNTQNESENQNSTVAEQKTVSNEAATINVSRLNSTWKTGTNVESILQDKNGNYWFGTNGQGVYRYDEKTLIQFTDKDGLCNNQVRTIREDKSGNIWFGTAYGICRYDGKSFKNFIDPKDLPASFNSGDRWQSSPEDLWFEGEAGVYRFNGTSFSYLRLPKCPLDSQYSKVLSNRINPYTVYCTFKDKKGRIWFGTQTLGVCCYNGKSFNWLTEKGLSGPAIRGLFEDKNGNLWFGNNGYGLFRWDGKSLTNVTEENGLGNEDFFKTSRVSADKPGTLARVWTINEDNNGDIWIGTIDAGVWRYNGRGLTNYTQKDGLSSNIIYTIYKDRRGELLFGTGTGVYMFNGKSFTKFVI